MLNVWVHRNGSYAFLPLTRRHSGMRYKIGCMSPGASGDGHSRLLMTIIYPEKSTKLSINETEHGSELTKTRF